MERSQRGGLRAWTSGLLILYTVPDELVPQPSADAIASTVDVERSRKPHQIGDLSGRQVELEAKPEQQPVAGIKVVQCRGERLMEVFVSDPGVGRPSILRRQGLHVDAIGEEIHELLPRCACVLIPVPRVVR